MSNTNESFEVELVEKEIAQVEFIEKELVDVTLSTVDVISRKIYITDLRDVELTNLEDEQILQYDSSSEKWENKDFSLLQSNCFIFNETPSKITSTQFETAHNYEADSLVVYLNGLKEAYITEDSDTKFSFNLPVLDADVIQVSYIKK